MRKFNDEGFLIVGERDCCERFEPEEVGLLSLRECWHCKWADFHKHGLDKCAKESICRYEKNRKEQIEQKDASGREVCSGSCIRYDEDIRARMERDPVTGLRNSNFLKSSVEIALSAGGGGVLMLFGFDNTGALDNEHDDSAKDRVMVLFSD